MPTIQLTLISKPDCHLCDTAREVVDGVVAELGSAASVRVEELSILEHPDLYEKHVEEIPVVLINGRVHNIWRVDPARLKKAILEAAE
ncbi:MAG: glutaredoxin family protein [Microbacteriaceae bacterium]|nr:glutaredoxin family protein [Microbacteriaceae bacterium]